MIHTLLKIINCFVFIDLILDKMTLDEHTLYDEARDWIDYYIETHPDKKDNHKILLNMITK